MIKKLTLLLITFIISSSVHLFSQDFKPVKTAQDVIDNYITANGGEENMKKIKTVTMSGSVSAMNMGFPVSVYISTNYFYMKLESEMFGMVQVVDFKKRKGWMNFMNQVKDLTEEEITKAEKSMGGALWKYYLEKDKYNVSYKLLQDDTTNGKDCYVVEFSINDSTLNSVYFEKKTFNRLKLVDSKGTTSYYDIKEAGTSGIYLPFKIDQAQGDITVLKYEFNKKFDKKLLEKPEK